MALSSIPELVTALGGADRLASWAGYEDSRGVQNWYVRGVPPHYHLQLLAEAWDRGHEVDLSIFRLPERTEQILRAAFVDVRKRVQRRPLDHRETA